MDVLKWLIASSNLPNSAGGSDGPATGLGEESGERELEEPGKEIQTVVVRHPDEDVFHANLYPRILSAYRRHEDEARRTYYPAQKTRRAGAVQGARTPCRRFTFRNFGCRC